MPFSGNKWEVDKMMTYKDMVNTIKQNYPEFQTLPNHPNDTSKVVLGKFWKTI